MAEGFSVPVRVNQGGGVKTEVGTDQLDKIIRLAFSAGDDDNPFQDLGISESIIFQVNDPSTHGVLRSRVRAILQKFADRIQLEPSKGIQIRENAAGEVNLSFDYIDLETNELRDLTLTLV